MFAKQAGEFIGHLFLQVESAILRNTRECHCEFANTLSFYPQEFVPLALLMINMEFLSSSL